MEHCLFCKIIHGSIPSHKVYENDLFLGFLDVFPRSPGHTLIIPKKHYRWVYDVPEFDQYWVSALKVTKAVQSALNPSFVSYLTLGLQVPHAHIHVIPRYGESENMPDAKKASPTDLQDLAKKIRERM